MARHSSPPLPKLTPRGQQVMSVVLNSVAFGTHDDQSSVDSLADVLGTTPGRLRSMVRKLVVQGYLTVEGDVAEIVYPTADALRWQDPNLSTPEAKSILRRLRSTSTRSR